MNSLQFAHTDYSIQTKSIDIYSIGCDGCCAGCYNTELKDWCLKGLPAQQVLLKVFELNEKFTNLVDKIILLGGDPVDAYKHYPQEYIEFVKQLKQANKPIFLFTRYEYENVPKELLEHIDYLKTGPYLQEQTVDNNIQYGIKLATANQKIIKIEDK